MLEYGISRGVIGFCSFLYEPLFYQSKLKFNWELDNFLKWCLYYCFDVRWIPVQAAVTPELFLYIRAFKLFCRVRFGKTETSEVVPFVLVPALGRLPHGRCPASGCCGMLWRQDYDFTGRSGRRWQLVLGKITCNCRRKCRWIDFRIKCWIPCFQGLSSSLKFISVSAVTQ